MSLRAAIVPILSTAILAGCASAPSSPPLATVTPGERLAENAAVSVAPLPADWWGLYHDVGLNAAVREALENNRDLRTAAAHLLEVRAMLSETRSQLGPQTDFNAGVGSGSTFQDQLAAASDDFKHIRTGPRYDLGDSVSWELDLFGRLRSMVRAANADTRTSAALEDGVRVAVAAGVTGAWLDACGYGHSLEVARHSLALAEHGGDLSQRLLDAGAGTPIDVLRTDALVAQARAAIPPLEAGRHNALAELAVLTGHAPEGFQSPAATCTMLPTINSVLPIGDSLTMLRRRPDVRAAEQRLAASTARIGVAVGDLYPRLSLAGSASDSSPSLGGLAARNNLVWRIGPLLSWSFPNISSARARIRQARAREMAELSSFDGTILTALKEVNKAAEDYRAALQRQDALTLAAERSAHADRLVALQRTGGGATALELLDAQRSDVEAQAVLAAADREVARAQVVVFVALGGGWEDAPAVVLPSPQRSTTVAIATSSTK